VFGTNIIKKYDTYINNYMHLMDSVNKIQTSTNHQTYSNSGYFVRGNIEIWAK
jgi:hypothetical protein